MRSDPIPSRLTRRQLLQAAGGFSLAASPFAALADDPAAADDDVSLAAGPRPLVTYPGKRPLLRVTTRPPHLETPFSVFNDGVITPNDAFFVRYHLADIPTSIDPESFRLVVHGSVKTPLRLSLEEVKQLAANVEVVAVNQCSGNSRAYSSPRVFGAQLGNGAMGSARWVGVPVKAVLERAGIQPQARQIVFDGLDTPVLPSTSDFRKSLDVEHALSGEPMLAWRMNGMDLPMLNGYPLKLIVPGYFGTYWVKHVCDIEVIDQPFAGHDALFMTTAYRVPDNDCLCVAPGTAPAATRPISKLPVRSFLTSLRTGAQVPRGQIVELRGIAFDGGDGIRVVDVSTDGGKTWQGARLGQDLGRFSFREWRLPVRFAHAGVSVVMVRAANRGGEVQPAEATWNPAGYRRHAIESTPVQVV